MKTYNTIIGELEELPSAKEVKNVLGWVDIGTHRVHHHNNDGQERFPWRVLGPDKGELEPRDILEEFPQYREAVAYARRMQR